MNIVKDPHQLKPLFKFLNRLKRNPPRNVQSIAINAGSNAWNGVDCLACANCCRTMTPTYTEKDIKKIATFLMRPVVLEPRTDLASICMVGEIADVERVESVRLP